LKTHYDTSITLPSSIVAIGAFDGVHKGHQAVVKETVAKANLLGVESVIYTFDPPPRVFFQGASMLTTIAEKVSKLEKLGVDHVIVAKFDEVYATKSADEFIETLEKLHPQEIVVGDDFKFGKGRVGNIALLKNYFNVQVTDTIFCSNGERVSSTRIRELISRGHLQYSSMLLGSQRDF
jgi:riboflavin kinase / FMN adenylyltransferase